MSPSVADLTHAVYDPVLAWDSDGHIVEWNSAAAERYGYQAEEVIGKDLRQLLRWSFTADGAGDATRGGAVREGSVSIRCRDGQILSGSCRQVAHTDGRVFEVHGPVVSRNNVDMRLVLDHMPGLVSYIDRDLRYKFANQRYAEWFGTPPEQVVGARVEEVLGPQAFEIVRPHMVNALRGELVSYNTFLAYTRGSGKHVSVRYVPDRDPRTGEVRGFVVLVEDLTARYLAEQSRESSENQYRQIVETAHEGIWIIDAGGKTIFANGRMAELLGTTVEDLAGKDSFEFVFAEEREQAQHLFEAKVNGNREPFEFRLRRADGAPIWARISGVPMTTSNGEVIGLLGMFTDITASRAAELALRENEERFRTLLSNMPDIISRFDREGRIVYISPAVERATGQRPEALLGKTHSEAGIPDALASYLSSRLEQIFRTGAAATVDFEMPAPGGAVHLYHGIGVPEFGEDGEAKTVLTIVRDTTDQRRAEEALRRSNAELEQFAYAAAHDLQEPLRVVATYTELFLRKYVSSDPGAPEVARFIQNGVRRLQELVRDLLTYSRAVHEEPFPPAQVDLNAVLDEVLSALDSGDAALKSHIVREHLPTVKGDHGQFSLVFQNLLTNAMKYRPAGQIPEIRVGAMRAEGEWVVSVQDNGIGFDPFYAERIFGLFKRLHRDAYPGTGVGLGICKRIVERYGGRIWAESEGEGRGATFRFTAPAAD